jgi:hypothetical protein
MALLKTKKEDMSIAILRSTILDVVVAVGGRQTLAIHTTTTNA